MKILRLEIENCNDCPFMEWDYSRFDPGRQTGITCREKELTIGICFSNVSKDTEIRIPDFCPLEDAEGRRR